MVFEEPEDRQDEPGTPRVEHAERELAVRGTGQERPMGRRRFVGDVGPGVAHADDEDRSVGELRGFAVLARVELPDRSVELTRDRRDLGDRERAGRDDHLPRPESAVAGDGDEIVAAVVDPHQAIHARRRSDWQPHRGGIRLDVVRHLATGGVAPAGRRERHPRQAVPACRAEQPERLVATPPLIADPFVRVQDEEGPTQLREVVAGGQSGLARPDDHRVDLLGRILATHVTPHVDLQRRRPTVSPVADVDATRGGALAASAEIPNLCYDRCGYRAGRGCQARPCSYANAVAAARDEMSSFV